MKIDKVSDIEKNKREKVVGRKLDERDKELQDWVPATEIGKAVKNGEITSVDEIFDKNIKIKEPQIVDYLIPDIEDKMIDFKKTTKVRRAGRKFSFRVSMLVGDKNKYIGLGTASDSERWPAVRKATKNAKLNLTKIIKGCGSWECVCAGNHSVPFKTEGRSSSVKVVLFPAPKGTGLVVGDNIKDVFRFVGIKDVWSKTSGNTGSKLDFVAATIDALSKTTKVKLSEKIKEKLSG